jgi:hypothetical protein
VSAPWWHPESNPLRDIQEFQRKAERQYAALFAVPAFSLGPEPLRCPACGMTWQACRQLWGRDPVHDQQIRDALRLEEPDG